ncbi:ATP-binding protein [Lamprobacter modestohalophilus]|nr:ATP-binding protein [Lamprobacter modestohalophilus]
MRAIIDGRSMRPPRYGLLGSIRWRLGALVLVPLVVTSVVVGGFVLYSESKDRQASIQERGRLIANNLALAAEWPLRASDFVQLRAMCQTAVLQPEVIWAGIRDPSYRVLAESSAMAEFEQASRSFTAIVGNAAVMLADNPEQASGETAGALLGWAEVRLSMEMAIARQRERLVRALWILFGGLLTSLLAALFIGAGFSRALVDLSAAMARYRAGDLAARARPQRIAELNELAIGFNRMAAALERSQRSMQQRVDAATRELCRSLRSLEENNLQLERAREEALVASQQKDEFLARISHEMRTPLNAVVGFGRLLSDEADTDAARDYSETLERAARQLLSVVDDILQYAKLRSGSLSIESVPFDPCSCLEDVVAIMGPEASAKGLELALSVHRDLPSRLRGDPGRIGQVLLNLLNNAVKFTGQGQVFVEASYVEQAGSPGMLRVVVSDTGIGLTAAQQRRLFRPFVQADSSVTRRYGGTGLGLVITKCLLELMNGSIEVGSAPSQGSRFVFTLPCEAVPGVSLALDAVALAGRKILLCDLAPIQVRALRPLLLGWGMEVFATRAQGCLDRLQHDAQAGRGFDLLLLAVAGRDRKGDELARQLTLIRRRFAGPVVLLVGEYRWVPPPFVEELGPVSWCPKPVRRSRLFNLLCRLCGDVPSDRRPASGRDDLFLGMRALVVDDNDFNRALLHRLLETRGMEVFDSSDGVEALRLTRALELDLDLVFMDIHMPSLDGTEVAQRLRAQLPDGGRLRIIALSADAFVAERVNGFDALFDAFLLKPISESVLDDAVKRVLAAERSRTLLAHGPSADQLDAETALRTCSAPTLDADWRQRLDAELLRQLARAEAAISAANRREVGERVHDLKGLCAVFQLETLTNEIRVLEQEAEAAPFEALHQRIGRLRALLASVTAMGEG